jgi:hypothetical protein
LLAASAPPASVAARLLAGPPLPAPSPGAVARVRDMLASRRAAAAWDVSCDGGGGGWPDGDDDGTPPLASPSSPSHASPARDGDDWWAASSPTPSLGGPPRPRPPARASPGARLAALARPRAYDWVAVQKARDQAEAEARMAPARRPAGSGPPVEARLAAAAAATAARLAAARQAADAAELESCTFAPALSPVKGRAGEGRSPLADRAAALVAGAAARRAAAAAAELEGLFEPSLGEHSRRLAAAVRAAGGPARPRARERSPPPPFAPALNPASLRLVEASPHTPTEFHARQAAAAAAAAARRAAAADRAAAEAGAAFGATTRIASHPPVGADWAAARAAKLAAAAAAALKRATEPTARPPPGTDERAAAARARPRPPSRAAALAAAAAAGARSPPRRRAARDADPAARAAAAARARARREAALAASTAAADDNEAHCTFSPALAPRLRDPAPTATVADRVAGAASTLARAARARAMQEDARKYAARVFHERPAPRHGATRPAPFSLATGARAPARAAADGAAASVRAAAECPFRPETGAAADAVLLRALVGEGRPRRV